MKNATAPGLFGSEPMSGPEVLARLDSEIASTEKHLKALQELRAGLFDLQGMDKVELQKTADPVRSALLYFDKKHKETLNAEAMITWGKDNAIMKPIVKQYNGQTERLIDEFFTFAGGADEYLNRMGFTVQTFRAKLPALIARLHGPQRMAQVTRNTADNGVAVSRAAQVIRGSRP